MFKTGLSLDKALQVSRQRLAACTETPGLDAQVLLAFILDKPRPWVMAHPEANLSQLHSQALESALERLEHGEPMPYVLGHWEFFGLDFIVTSDVLIPRPETELLVELTLDWLREHPNRRRAVDVGTGSGCIAISLAANIPDLRLLAVDISRPALQVARLNAERHTVADRVFCLQSDLLSALNGPFDLICANLPYVPFGYHSKARKTVKPAGRQPQEPAERGIARFTRIDMNENTWLSHEPHQALYAGPEGLSLIRRLVQDAPCCLAPGGVLLMEIEASQGKTVNDLVQQGLPTAQVKTFPDLAGHDRVVFAQTIETTDKKYDKKGE
ncbi:MAG: peptide chain release factor N(5)-glutamine methyltransferase [Anaerolineales bacterium]|nr:peptide chain release factor N(5)-glutamine methyltransferase [Anaerolineales bacterium]